MMKDVNQFITERVVRIIADDYESIELVLEHMSRWAAGLGIALNRQIVMNALEQVINDGYAQAHLLSPSVKEVDYSADRVDELWFYVTPKGIQLARDRRREWGGQPYDFPTTTELQGNASPVGVAVREPSMSRWGWTSEEQKYICRNGHTYTIHCLVSPNGTWRQCHVRGGLPKGG